MATWSDQRGVRSSEFGAGGLGARSSELGALRLLLVALVLMAGVVEAHPRGFHKKLVLTAYRTRLEGLMTMDADGAERTRGLRAAADTDGNGKLSQDE